MFEFLRSTTGVLTLVFVVSSMLNVGLTQDPRRLLAHLRDWRYLLRMVVANFFVVPGVMLLFVAVFDIPDPYRLGLVLFSLAAGAPLLIKLAEASDNDVAAGATVQMVLMVATILIMPWLLPLVLDGAHMEVLPVARALLLQMLAPLAVGMVLFQVAEPLVARVQPWVARLSTVTMYGMLVVVVLGHLPELADLQLWLAVGAGLVVLLLAFAVGHGTGQGNPEHAQIGGLGTGQRNTAAALIVAQTSFEDPRVFVTAMLLNAVGMFMLLFIATRMRPHQTRVDLLEPLESDRPRRRAEWGPVLPGRGSSTAEERGRRGG